MSCGNMLRRFHSLLPEIIEFRNLKCPLTELEDENWLCDLGFMVDITINQSINFLFSAINT